MCICALEYKGNIGLQHQAEAADKLHLHKNLSTPLRLFEFFFKKIANLGDLCLGKNYLCPLKSMRMHFEVSLLLANTKYKCIVALSVCFEFDDIHRYSKGRCQM